MITNVEKWTKVLSLDRTYIFNRNGHFIPKAIKLKEERYLSIAVSLSPEFILKPPGEL